MHGLIIAAQLGARLPVPGLSVFGLYNRSSVADLQAIPARHFFAACHPYLFDHPRDRLAAGRWSRARRASRAICS
jgi:hypothetical protein